MRGQRHRPHGDPYAPRTPPHGEERGHCPRVSNHGPGTRSRRLPAWPILRDASLRGARMRKRCRKNWPLIARRAPDRRRALKAGKMTLGRGPKRALEAYVQKRDFARTPEPTPQPEPKGKSKRTTKRTKATALAFVVQRHDARRLHFDLRLELDGTLKSWAVTRGPSLVVSEKRLAVHTEDHPIEYLDFEGNIPKGEYGGGTMIVWDRGTWTPEGDPHFGLTKGHLAFTLDGSRLKGKWHLVRMRKKAGERSEPWLLIKSDDEFARAPDDPDITAEETSHLTGRTSGEVAARGRAAPGPRGAHDREKGPQGRAARHRPHRRRTQKIVAGVRRAEPGVALRQATERAEMGARDQARRLPHPGADRRRRNQAAHPQEPRLDRALRRDRGCAGGAASRLGAARRRDRGRGRERHRDLQRPAG